MTHLTEKDKRARTELRRRKEDFNRARIEFLRNEIERNPRISLNELGEMCGVTRERIRQILKKAGIEKLHARGQLHPEGFCINGHKLPEIRATLSTSERCLECVPLTPNQYIDQDTGHIRSRTLLAITCTQCGKTIIASGQRAFQRRRYDRTRKTELRYCGSECQRKDIGTKWGWGSSNHPNRINSKTRTIPGSCHGCGKTVERRRVKKQYMEDPSIQDSFKSNRMYCSRECFYSVRRAESLRKSLGL